MKNLITLLLVACVMFLTVGCKDKSPKGLCDHAWDSMTDDEKKEIGEEDKFKKSCTESFEEIKKEATEESYDEFSSCVLDASKQEEAMKCMKKLKSK